jgi:hypothetical protein
MKILQLGFPIHNLRRECFSTLAIAVRTSENEKQVRVSFKGS